MNEDNNTIHIGYPNLLVKIMDPLFACGSNIKTNNIYFVCDTIFKNEEKDTIRNSVTKQRLTANFHTWLLNTLEHEYLHQIINKLEGKETSLKLDKISLEWDMLIEKIKEDMI